MHCQLKTNKVELSDLHGTALVSESNDDPGFCDQIKSHEPEEDDVFYEEDSGQLFPLGTNLPSIAQNHTKELSKVVVYRSRQTRTETTQSSGYGSDVKASISSSDQHVTNVVVERITTRSKNVAESKKDSFSQTDFPSEADETKMQRIVDACIFEKSSQKETQFCWRHDDIYEGLLPPRSTAVSPNDENRHLIEDLQDRTYRIRLSSKSCRSCQAKGSKKLDLNSRLENVRLTKEQMSPTVAKVKSCPVNLLHTQIKNCSNLWTENRTFYLGPESGLSKIKEERQRTMSLPTLGGYGKLNRKERAWSYLHCNDQLSNDDLTTKHKPCSRHLFWIPPLSRGKSMVSRGREMSENKRKQRDWILVQCVTKFGPNMNSQMEAGEKLTYRKYGNQEVVLCPAELRSLNYIENICCQHFIKLSREEALENDRTIELLFSPMGPMLREDKDLTGEEVDTKQLLQELSILTLRVDLSGAVEFNESLTSPTTNPMMRGI